MPNATIDLRKIKNGLKSGAVSENRLSQPLEREEKLLMTEKAVHPDLKGPADERAENQANPPGVIFKWRAPEFDYHPQKNLTSLLFGVLLCLGAIAALFFKNFLFSILLVISGGLVIHRSSQEPSELYFYISSRGMKIGARLYRFEDLESFWIFYDPPSFKELILRSKKALVPIIRVPLGEANPLEIREVLLRFLKEEKHEDSLVDVISRSLGF